MPTERHGKVRRLLRDGLAHVFRLQPFTIQLDYESTTYKQEISLGIDAGSVHIGVSATTEKKELFAADVTLRQDMVKKISDRRELRESRRGRNNRHRKMRLYNRRLHKGWLAPSIMYKVNSHLNIISWINSILPIARTSIEVAQFDIQKIKDDKIQGIEYQNGEQKGYYNVREYVLARDGHLCQHCKGQSGDNILNVHHLESRKTGGNAPNNLITLCETCHKAYHRGEFELKIRRGTSLRNTAAMNIMRWAVYNRANEMFKNVRFTYGYITKHIRIENDIEKTHCADAFCISGNVKADRLGSHLQCRCVQRHNRILHVSKPKRGGRRRSAIASHWIKNSRFQKYDTVEWNGIKCFISGSTNGYLVLRDINKSLITPTRFVKSSTVRFIHRKQRYLIYQV